MASAKEKRNSEDSEPVAQGKRATTLVESPKETAGPRSGKAVGAVTGAIKILRYLGQAVDPGGVSKIARETKLNTSTAFNILRTLVLEDFVTFDPTNKTYTLSLGIIEIAEGATALRGDIGTVRPMMERLADLHGVTLTIWQPVAQNRKLLILSAVNRAATRIQMSVGQRLPIYIGATGRVFAAFGSGAEKDIRQRFDEIRWDQPISFDEFMWQVRLTKEKGWALDDGNYVVGTASVACPIFDRNNVATMAVTATMFTGHYTKERAAALVTDLETLGEQVSRLLTR